MTTIFLAVATVALAALAVLGYLLARAVDDRADDMIDRLNQTEGDG